MPDATAGNPSFVSPINLYSQDGFISASGIAYDRIAKAKKDGIPFPGFHVGRRIFIRGDLAIKYIEELAAHDAAKKEAE